MSGADPNSERFQTSSGEQKGGNKSWLCPGHAQAQIWRDKCIDHLRILCKNPKESINKKKISCFSSQGQCNDNEVGL